MSRYNVYPFLELVICSMGIGLWCLLNKYVLSDYYYLACILQIINQACRTFMELLALMVSLIGCQN